MNYCLLIGRLTRDVDLMYQGENEMAVARMSIAVDRQVKTGDEKQADFFNVTAFGRAAENCSKYLKKGRLFAVQGKLHSGKYTNKEGKTIYTTDVIADRVEFLEWSKEKTDKEDVVEDED